MQITWLSHQFEVCGYREEVTLKEAFCCKSFDSRALPFLHPTAFPLASVRHFTLGEIAVEPLHAFCSGILA